MNVKISMALFAFAALLQLTHSIPTHRFARESPKDLTSQIKEYYKGSASELNPSVAAKEGNSAESNGFTSSFQNYIPSFGSYPSQLPSQFNPSQYGQYPSQLPSQFNPSQYNPSQYMPSSGSAATPTGAASELHPAVAAKEGNSAENNGFTSSFQNYIPSQVPSQFNPSQYAQYPNQLPSQFNPNQYNPSQYIPSSGSAASPAGAASELHPSVAAKEGNSAESNGFTSSFQNYIPSQVPSQFNPSQYAQYPNQLPSQFNPNQYNPSQYIPSSGSAATPTGAASELHPSVAAKEGNSAESNGFTSSFQSYIPSFGSYPSSFPSQFNPSQYGQFNPSQYIPTSSSSPATTSSAAQGASSANP